MIQLDKLKNIQEWFVKTAETNNNNNFGCLMDESLESALVKKIFSITPTLKLNQISTEASPLDSALLLYQACQENKYLMIASMCRNDYRLLRNYDRLLILSDAFPCADFTQTELIEMSRMVGIPPQLINSVEEARKIIKGHGFTEEELEWLDQLDVRTNLITGSQDPTKYYGWFGFSVRQKEIISKLYVIEKQTRHKVNPNANIYRQENLI